MKPVSFEQSAFAEFVEWGKPDNKLQAKIVDLILDILRHPYSGLGKPKPLQHKLGSDAPGSGLNLTGLADLSGLVTVTTTWCITTIN